MAPFFGFHELNNKKLAVLRSDWGTSKTTELFLYTIVKGYLSLRLIMEKYSCKTLLAQCH